MSAEPSGAPSEGVEGEGAARLCDDVTGLFEILTQTATYLLDLDECTLTRYPDRPATTGAYLAAPLRKDGLDLPLLKILRCALGAPLLVLVDVRGDGVSTLRQSTPVRRIERLR